MLQLHAGDVFHLWCAHCKPPKLKFYVVAAIEPQLRYFLINSQPAPFQLKKPILMGHQVAIREADHGFLNHDSVIDCTEVYGGPSASDLEDIWTKDHRVHIGRIETSARRAVRHVVQHSVLLSPNEMAAILRIW